MLRMIVFLWKVVSVLLFIHQDVKGTLTPAGTISLDCVSQETFTCDVTGPAALWNINISGVTASGITGSGVSSGNPSRIIDPVMNSDRSSTITIIGFTTDDDGGTIQCVNLNKTVEGVATISIELPSCPTSFSANRNVDFTSATVTYQLESPPPVTSTTVTYCPTSSPNCADSMACPSTGPCTIGGLDPCVEYNLTAIPTNNCGGATGCTGNSRVVDSQDVPPQLTNVDVQEIKDTSVQVTWNEPSSTVTSVTVTYCPESTPDCRINFNCTTSPCTINGLMPNTTYDFSVTPNNNCGPGNASSKSVTTNSAGSGTNEPSKLDIVVIVVPIVAAIILMVLIVIIVIVVVIWRTKKKHGVKDNSSARMSRLRSNEERANLGEDTYASPGTEKPQPDTTDGVYSYAATETKIGAQMKEREQQKKQPPPQGDFYEEPNAAKNVQHKAGTITGETYAQPDKPKRGTKKKDKQQKEPVPHKEAPAGDLYAMPDKKKDISHTSGPVTGDEYAIASKPKTGGGYGAHGPQ